MKDITKYSGRLGNQLFQFAYIYSQFREGNIPDIYVQDYEYFDKYREELRELFREDIGYMPYVAIHLRVGKNPVNPEEPSYINNPFYVPLAKTGYYIDAINQFGPDRKFLVFSDDTEFAKTYFVGDKFAFDEGGDTIDVFNRMASCDSFIIANSSFSWWAAYLSPHPAKIVVAPTYDKWYKDGSEIRTKIPKTWRQV